MSQVIILNKRSYDDVTVIIKSINHLIGKGGQLLFLPNEQGQHLF